MIVSPFPSVKGGKTNNILNGPWGHKSLTRDNATRKTAWKVCSYYECGNNKNNGWSTSNEESVMSVLTSAE
jgi:hypothetical protein